MPVVVVVAEVVVGKRKFMIFSTIFGFSVVSVSVADVVVVVVTVVVVGAS